MEADELPPHFLNKEFLQEVLAAYRKNESLEVTEFRMNSSFSEHFASSMFQCSVDFVTYKNSEATPETLNLVIKAEPVNKGMKKEIVNQGPLFATEIKMYKETLPVINQLLESSGMKANLAPE